MSDKGAKLQLLPFVSGNIETMAVLRKEAEARQALAELKGFAPGIPNQDILISAIVLREARESSAIENIVTTHDELYKNLTMSTGSGDSAAKEVINYREAVFKGYSIVKKQQFIRARDIVGIQETIVENNAGIRRLPGTFLVNDATGKVVHTPPQDYRTIQDLLGNFCEYFNDGENSLWKMALLHYQFECIHPFYDGNGRTGRILNILYLLLKNYLDSPILYLSSYIIKNKNGYYALLQETRKKKKYEPWILYVLNGIEETSKQTLEKIRAIKNLLESTIEEVKKNAPEFIQKNLWK